MSDGAAKRPYVVALLILLWVAGTLRALVVCLHSPPGRVRCSTCSRLAICRKPSR